MCERSFGHRTVHYVLQYRPKKATQIKLCVPLFLISFLFSQQKHGAAEDVTQTLELALKASGRESDQVANQSLLLSYNGASYIAADLAEWLEARGIRHIRGASFHPQTQGKIERWHQTLTKRILLKHYYLLSHLVLLSKPKIARNLSVKLDPLLGEQAKFF